MKRKIHVQSHIRRTKKGRYTVVKAHYRLYLDKKPVDIAYEIKGDDKTINKILKNQRV